MKRFLVSLVMVFVLVLGSVQPANADTQIDTRPCVSMKESLAGSLYVTRTQLEKRWEVTGMGKHRTPKFLGYPVMVYPLCEANSKGDFAFASFRSGELRETGYVDSPPLVK